MRERERERERESEIDRGREMLFGWLYIKIPQPPVVTYPGNKHISMFNSTGETSFGERLCLTLCHAKRFCREQIIYSSHRAAKHITVVLNFQLLHVS